jgi:hypothetical protein
VLDKLYWALVAEEEVKVHFNGNLLVENKTGLLYFEHEREIVALKFIFFLCNFVKGKRCTLIIAVSLDLVNIISLTLVHKLVPLSLNLALGKNIDSRKSFDSR